jgi:hypothetical protein
MLVWACGVIKLKRKRLLRETDVEEEWLVTISQQVQLPSWPMTGFRSGSCLDVLYGAA